MGVEIEIAPVRTKLAYFKRVDGVLIGQDRFDPLSAKQRPGIARTLGVDEATLLTWIDKVLTSGTKQTFKPEGSIADMATLTIRDITSSEGTPYNGEPKELLPLLLPGLSNEKLLCWKDEKQLSCLDVDYHDRAAPDTGWTESIMLTRLAPRPIAWNLSKSGGIHAFYVSADGFEARDLAAAAALRYRTIDPTAGVELKRQIRGPGDKKVFFEATQDTSGLLSEWLGVDAFDTERRDEWLASEGMELSARYNHDRCPIQPTPDQGESRKPVITNDEGIFCHQCGGKGLSLGSRRPGWAPWATILGTPSSGDIGCMVRNLTHWGHAKWTLMERLGLPEDIARRAYNAACSAYHRGRTTEPLVPNIFARETEGMARARGRWMSIQDGVTLPKDIAPRLGMMPVAQYVGDKGVVKANAAIVNELGSLDIDLRKYGYPELDAISGLRMTAQFLDTNQDRTVVALPTAAIRTADKKYHPAYIPYSKRMPEDEAWGVLEEVFPKVDHNLLKCLVAAVGCAQELKLGLMPVIFVAGTSAAGKTSHCKLAAALLGITCEEPVFTSDTERFRQSIGDAMESSPLLCVSEVFKDAMRSRQRLTPAEALQPVLNLTPDSRSHKLYTGSVKLGRMMVLVLTEIICPQAVADETQLARRIRFHKLQGSRREWKASLAKAGLSNIHNLRLLSTTHAQACNSIVSEIIDNHFAAPTMFDHIADSLGVHTLEDSPDFDDPTGNMRYFFKLVSEAPAISDKNYQRKFPGKGYKRISRYEDSGDLLEVYNAFADGAGSDWMTSRKLTERDWSKILQVDVPVNIDLKNDGSAVYVRFFVGPHRAPKIVNEEITNPSSWEF